MDAKAHGKFLIAAVAMAAMTTGLASAAERLPTQPLKLELNKLEAADSACRVNFVVRNGGEDALTGVTADLVFFDRDGVILTRRVLDLGRLKPHKTQVLSFPMESFRCEQLGEVLLNEALSGGDGAAADCTDLVQVSHRGGVPFVK